MERSDIEKMQANKDVEGLIEALKDKDWNVQRAAAYALGDIGDKRAVEPLLEALLEALKNNDLDIQMSAAGALGMIGEPAVIPLIEVVMDKRKDSNFRWWAAEALVKMGEPAVEPLTKVLEDEDSDVRSYAAEALKKIKAKKS